MPEPEGSLNFGADEEHAMTLLLEYKLDEAANEFMRLCGATEATLPLVIKNLGQFATIMKEAGYRIKSADHLLAALQGYFFHGLLQEFLGRKQMDETKLKSAQASYEFVKSITGDLDKKNDIFLRVANRFGFQETMRIRIKDINDLLSNKHD